MKHHSMPSRRTHLQAGVSLVELMVSLVLGLFLIFGAVTIYSKSRATYRTAEAVARLQETARYAFDAIEPDVRMAGYWGLSNRAAYILNRASSLSDAIPTPTDNDLDDATTLIDQCQNNWLVDLDQYIAGRNGSGETDLGLSTDCEAYRDAWQGNTDTLTIRRGAEAAPDELAVDNLYLQTSRIQGTIFYHTDGACLDPKDPACIPDAYSPPASETRELLTTMYYVSNESVARPDVPSLRRKRLVNGAILDEEVVSGVEDMQVQFGIDTNADTNADVYVDPQDDPAAYGGTIVSATIWLRVRADEIEVGFTDDGTYDYADLDAAGEPELAVPNDNFRRFVVSKTIQIRNTRS
jgi:type IV pilus assembly protein PilW